MAEIFSEFYYALNQHNTIKKTTKLNYANMFKTYLQILATWSVGTVFSESFRVRFISCQIHYAQNLKTVVIRKIK